MQEKFRFDGADSHIKEEEWNILRLRAFQSLQASL
jgi:hypothetical protein